MFLWEPRRGLVVLDAIAENTVSGRPWIVAGDVTRQNVGKQIRLASATLPVSDGFAALAQRDGALTDLATMLVGSLLEQAFNNGERICNSTCTTTGT